MAQSLHIDLSGPFANLPFGICAIYFDLEVYYQPKQCIILTKNPSKLPFIKYCVIPQSRIF